MSKYSLGFVIANVLLLAVHLVLGFLDLISIIAVIVAPAAMTMISVFVHFLFAYCINKDNFSILAGFDKEKDDVAQVKKQLNAIGFFNSAFALLLNVVFFAAYAFPHKGQGIQGIVPSLIFLGVYIIVFALIVLCVNLKIKTRK